MIQQKKGPKKILFVRIPVAAYLDLNQMAGEKSLALFVANLLEQYCQQASTFCNSQNPSRNIGAEYHVR